MSTTEGMDISWQRLGDTAYLIARPSRLPLLYAPLQGLAMEVNDVYAEKFRRALAGDADAAHSIGVDPGMVERLMSVPSSLEQKLEPRWPKRFEPTAVTLFLTHKCTLRCTYCYCEGGAGRDIDWDVVEASVRFTLGNAVRLKRPLAVSFHGGDVGACWSLFTRAVEFIEAQAAEAGVQVVMSIGTNGFYTPEQAAYIAAHMQSATLSVDGISRVHDTYRVRPGGGPSLETVLRTARIFEEKELTYSVRMTVTAESVKMLAESVAFLCENTNAKGIRAEPLYSRGRASASHLAAPEPAEFVAAYREAWEVARLANRELTYSGARLTGVLTAFCSYPTPTFGVTPDANITCCYEILRPDDELAEQFFYGHVAPDGTVIADSSRIAVIREDASRRRASCVDCFCVHSCAGDCATKALDSIRRTSGDSARCEMTRALTLDMLEDALGGAR